MPSFFYTLITHPIIPAFLVANLAIGFWAHRKAKVDSFEDYALASRDLPTGVLVMTLLATFVARGDLGAPGYVFHYGILEALALVFFVLSFFITGTLLAPYLVYFRDKMTMGDLMGDFYGKEIQVLSGIFGTLISSLVIIEQFRAIGEVSRYLLGWSPKAAIVCFGIVVILYSIWGGVRSISYTDVLQIIGIFISLSIILRVLITKIGSLNAFFEAVPEKKLLFFEHPKLVYKIKSALFWALFSIPLILPPIMQRMLMVNSKRQVRQMWYLGGLLYFILGCMLVLIGLVAIAVTSDLGLDKSSNSLLLKIVKELFKKEKIMVRLIFVSFIGVLISTIDSFLHATAVIVVQDIFTPIRAYLNKEAMRVQTKISSARIAVLTIGILTVAIAGWKNSSLESNTLSIYRKLISTLFTMPLIFGIIGIKTNRKAFWSFCMTYVMLCASLKWYGWHTYDYFLLALPLATLAYFLTHLIQNRGIVTLKRSELTVAERLWLPSWSGLRKKVISFVQASLHLSKLADRKVVSTPMHSLAFSMLIFALYTLSSIFSSGGAGSANFMAGIHVVGITLCCGLMLQGIWPAGLKPYFPLYWFVTLFYCLPFGGTLAFLRLHEGPADVVFWVVKLGFLAFLVDSMVFCLVGGVGSLLAFGGWHVCMGGIPRDFWNDYTLMGLGILLGMIMAILLFGRSKEERTEERLYWNRVASSILGHDLRSSTQMLGGAGHLLERTFERGEPSTNSKGEKGYWLPFAQSKFLAQFSEEMNKKAADTRKEISNFLGFIQHQIMGTFEQEGVSMRSMTEEGMAKIKAQIKPSRAKIVLECKKDFQAKVLSGIFPNVISNLLMNAVTHGKASEIKLKIDGATRTITVWDNGHGITADVLPRIFDLGYSSSGSGKENSGVGLAFAKMVLDASGAKISCHSRAGKGGFTEFVMVFDKV